MYSVLYVDDEQGLLDLGKAFLEEEGGMQVDITDSAQEALEKLRSPGYDCVVSDYLMPELDGIVFLRAVRATGNRIPFILFTGRGREEVVIQALNEGADFYLQKGGDPKALFTELSHKIRQAVGRHRAEQALADRESQLHTLINNMPDIVCFKDGEGRWLEANAYDLDLFQLTNVDYFGKKDSELAPFSPFYREAFLACEASDEEAWAKKTVGRGEEVIPRPDGTTRTFDIIKVPVFNTDGSRRGLVVVGRDITERKNAEGALNSAHERLAASEEELRGQLAELRGNDQRIRENESRLRYMLGFYEKVRQAERDLMAYAVEGAGVVTGSPLGYLAFLSDDETELAMYAWSNTAMEECSLREKPIFYKVAKTGLWGEAVRQRRAIITNDYAAPNPKKKGYPDGHPPITRHMNVPIFDGDHIVILAGVANRPSDYSGNEVRQLTLLMQELWQSLKRRRAEEALREQVEKLAKMQAELKRQQQQLIEIAEMVPGVVYQFYARDDGTMGVYYVSSRAAGVFGFSGDPGDFFPWFTAQVDERDRAAFLGSINDVVNTATPWNFEGRFTRPSGRPIWFQGISRPVRHGNELVYNGILLDVTERRRVEDALREVNKKLNLLSGMTSHDISNKITLQLGLLELAQKKVKGSLEMDAFIRKIMSAAESIRDQIAFARTYHDLGVHEPQWQDLHQTLAGCPVPAPLSVSDNCAGLEVFSDIMLGKVFANLIDNAVRHGGNVTTIRMTASEAGGTLVVRFEDDGTGVPAGEKEKIFGRGYGKNTGLGLFLSREILDVTGISIRETGEPGKGARFEITVPKGSWRSVQDE